jgi:hypothetical protein
MESLTPENKPCAYVLRIVGGPENLYKVGKAKSLEERLRAHRTMSIGRLEPYAEIETEHYNEIETFLKHSLQGNRWLEGEGKELYQVEPRVIDAAIEAARRRADLIPRMTEAESLSEEASDETVLTPDNAAMALYRERLRVKAAEWVAKHEGERVDAELKLLMGSACELEGVATFRSATMLDFDEARFRDDHKELYESYVVMKPVRQFRIQW